MAEQWHYSIDGEERGPVSREELEALAQRGELKPTDYVWKDGMPEWAAAETIEGLFGGGGAPAAPSAPARPAPPRGPAPAPAAHGGPSPLAGKSFMEIMGGLPGILIASGVLLAFINTFLPWVWAGVRVGSRVIGGGYGLGITWWPGIICFLLLIGVGVCWSLWRFVASLKPNAKVFHFCMLGGGGGVFLFSLIAMIVAIANKYDSPNVGPFFGMAAGGAMVAGGLLLVLKPGRWPE